MQKRLNRRDVEQVVISGLLIIVELNGARCCIISTPLRLIAGNENRSHATIVRRRNDLTQIAGPAAGSPRLTNHFRSFVAVGGQLRLNASPRPSVQLFICDPIGIPGNDFGCELALR